MDNNLELNTHTETNQLLDLTQTMLAAAESDNWDEFELQEQQRNAMLRMIFDGQTEQASDKPHLVDIIKEIQLIDQAIIELIKQQRDLAAQELRHLKHSRESNKAYQIAADDSL